MYKVANEIITGKGLSVGARVFLGLISALLGVVMVIIAEDSKFPIAIYLFGAFCFSITLACTTWGRVRQFVGSLIATVIVGLSIWYLWSEVTGGPFFSWRGSEPSVLNAIFFCLLLGAPSASYVVKVRFGFRKQQP
jgi:hypothetical protein